MPGMKQTGKRIYDWFEQRLQVEDPIKDAVLHKVRAHGELVVRLRQRRVHAADAADRDGHFAGAGLCSVGGRGMEQSEHP